jgi:predicted dehydrogenase
MSANDSSPLVETTPSRRDALITASTIAAGMAVASTPMVHAAGGDAIQLALVGAGGRGTGAADNALKTSGGPTKLVAMVDVFEKNLENSHRNLSKAHPTQVQVPPEHRFIGFDGYKKAMDLLKKGDVVILTTPVAFRNIMFEYAIQKGLHVFMEKPTTVDGPGTRKMFELAKKSVAAGLKVGVGLMCRHCDARGEMVKKIRDGAIGDITMMRAYRMAGPTASAFSNPKPAGIGELEYQIQRFHSFLWASGGAYSDFLIHNIDECCWIKDAWPIEAKSTGGRHYRGKFIDQNFDTYSTEFTFEDGAKMFMEGRLINGCKQEFASYAHGTKGSAVISESGHAPSRCRLFKSQKMVESEIIWKCQAEEPNPYQLEWDHLMDSIRNDKPHNEAERGAMASLVTSMGRMSAHTGQVIKRDQILNHEHAFAPDIDKLVLGGPAPVLADKDGKYPIPEPGIKTKREY